MSSLCVRSSALRLISSNRKLLAEWLRRNWNGQPQAFVPRVIPTYERWRIVGCAAGGEMAYPEPPDDSPPL